MEKRIDFEDECFKEAIRRSVRVYSDSVKRWKQYQRDGMTDEQLERAIKFEYGIYHGSCGPNLPGIVCKGSGLRFWYDCITEKGPPTLQGTKLRDMVRRVMGIPNPNKPQMSLF